MFFTTYKPILTVFNYYHQKKPIIVPSSSKCIYFVPPMIAHLTSSFINTQQCVQGRQLFKSTFRKSEVSIYIVGQQLMSTLDQSNLENSVQGQADEQTMKLLNLNNSKESFGEEFVRQRKMAQECCDLGRKHLIDKRYDEATKEFSKAVMTFEYILKNNLKQSDLKQDISDMLKNIIIPAYSNLSLCYLKNKRYDMVLTFANQVLASDSANIKNLYRRGLARKFTKAYDEAIQDFTKLISLDKGMESECRAQILECKGLKQQQKKKDKEIAKQFITGYAKDKPEPSPIQQQSVKAKESLWQRCTRCIKSICPRIFSKS